MPEATIRHSTDGARLRRLFQALMRNARDVIAVVDQEANVRWVSPSVERMLGFTPDEYLARSAFDLVHPEDVDAAVAVFVSVLSDPAEAREVALRSQHRDGRWLWVEATVTNLLDDPDVEGLVVNVRDVSERKRGEALVEENERRMSALVEGSSDVICVVDETTQIQYISPAVRRVAGFAPEEILGKTAADFVHPDDLNRAFDALAALLETPGGEAEVDLRSLVADGTYRWYRYRGRNLMDDPDVRGVVLNYSDIHDRKLADERVAEAEKRYRAIFEGSVAGIYATTIEGRFLSVNPSMAAILGYASAEELMDAAPNARDLYVDPARREDLVVLAMEHGVVQGFEVEVRRKDGSTAWVSLTARTVRDEGGRPVAFEGTFLDVTERKALEQQLSQSQKMEAVGRLAGGVAHDFNNILGIIQNYTRFVYDEMEAADPKREDLKEVMEAATRAANMVRQLMAFSRKQVARTEDLDPGEVIAGMLSLLDRALGEDVAVETDLGAAGWVHVDKGQLEQVLLNLAVNARDAMPGGGTLTIATRDEHLPDMNPLGLMGGGYVCLSVRDTGMGIPEDVLPHIFEPFFTTKPRDKGSGIGLATVYGVVTRSGGAIDVASVPGEGASFQIYLPAVLPTGRPQGNAERGRVVQGGKGTILLVEDEESVRAMVARILQRQGHDVMSAPSGPDALAAIDGRLHEVHLVLTDVIMPGMTGRQMVDRLRAQRPDLPVLFMSGYTDDVITQRGALGPNEEFIQKPFSKEELVAVVDGMLGAVSRDSNQGDAMERSDQDFEAAPEESPETEPADGPARAPGTDADPGATSQGQPSGD